MHVAVSGLRRSGQILSACAPAAAAALALTAGQAVWIRRRYSGAPPLVSAVDAIVRPAGHGPDDDCGAGSVPIRLVALGDSGMAGVGVERPADTLPVQLAQRVADETHRTVHVVGYARSGARTGDVLTEQLPRTGTRHDVAVVLVGTNDVTHVTPPAVLARRSAELLDALLALGLPVVLCSLPEFRAMSVLPHPLVDVAAGYANVVRRIQRRAAKRRPGVELVDVRAAVGQEFVHDRALMSADGFHPSAGGYGRIAAALAPAVVRAVAPVNPRPLAASRST